MVDCLKPISMKKTLLILPGFLCIHQVNFAAKAGSVSGLDAQGGSVFSGTI